MQKDDLRKKKTQAEEDACAAYLRSAGWRHRGDGDWLHKHLHFPWPAAAAMKLQDEADCLWMDPVHRQLRGEL